MIHSSFCFATKNHKQTKIWITCNTATRYTVTVTQNGMNEFKFDVDALFGEQAVKETEANETIRRGTRTRARKKSLTHGRSFGKLVSIHHGMSSTEVSNFELSEMRVAERDQTRTDMFWGLDKEAGDRACEIQMMAHEAEYSSQHELYCKTLNMHTLWEKEEVMRKEKEFIMSCLEEDNAGVSYMKTFYSTSTSGDIINFKWPTRPKMNEHSQPHEEALINNQKGINGFEIWTLVGEPSTIHLDGLQQSRTVSLNGDTYDPRKTASIADLAMRPAGTRKNKSANQQPPSYPSSFGSTQQAPQSPAPPLFITEPNIVAPSHQSAVHITGAPQSKQGVNQSYKPKNFLSETGYKYLKGTYLRTQRVF